ncbi:hypothetical protein LF599_08160 [Pseudodesulfovibrio thermohalotolerans]|uniref:hypothetical protein n=1 Tax=Pseudodesulfovibrio thermohalotolerans TaxID=2880651 RepID=UPI002443361B|nr:hypothetical protein [Pseudodesulfovibrio thermohalotolerans]WFS64118.1 hypothetical protein LF599_08160 [Pseudodesulfovibrio thermohalotolerans]
MSKISRLPGTDCRHHLNGRCLYEEWLNPGYTKSWRCQVTARWESSFDDFLRRAEFFGVAEDAAPDLWGRQFQRMARETFHCGMYKYRPGAPVPGCGHHLDGVCVMGLPRCSGRCRHYSLNTDEQS